MKRVGSDSTVTIVYTIGYEGTDIDRFIATLRSVGIKTLADVRALALSRKKGFSKSALKARLEAEGIKYSHFAKLGDPKPGRDAARAGRHDDFLRIYTQHLNTVEPQASLALLADMVRKSSTCLLCYERDPSTCHRTIVTDRMKARGIEVVDLFSDGSNCNVTNAKLARRHAREGASQSQQEVR